MPSKTKSNVCRCHRGGGGGSFFDQPTKIVGPVNKAIKMSPRTTSESRGQQFNTKAEEEEEETVIIY